MTQHINHKTLQTELIWLMICGAVGLLIAAGLLLLLTGTGNALQYLAFSSALWLLVWQQTHKRLTHNQADAYAPLYPTLGWANRMTIARGWMIAATGGFLLIPDVLVTHPVLLWIAAALYSVAAIFDRADGYIARRSNRTSLLGAELDTVFDALGLLVAPLLALQHGKIHVAYLLVSIAYYLFVLGIKVRERHDRPVYPLPPSLLRRSLAGFQMGYVAVVLWPPFRAEVTVLAGFGFMLPLLAGFWVDWLMVSGRLKPNPPFVARLSRISRDWLLPIMRLATALSAWLLITRLTTHSPAPDVAVVGLLTLGAVLITLGLAARAAAVMVLMVLAWLAPVAIYPTAFVICLFTSIAIVLLGSGRFSLWQADDDWVNRQDGA